jgi:uncharacterized protein
MKGSQGKSIDESTAIEFPLLAVQTAFQRVRKVFHLGVGELQAAIDAVQGGFGGTDSQALGLVLRSLWCHSELDQLKWEIEWRMVVKAIVEQAKERKPMNESSFPENQTEDDRSEEISPSSVETVIPNLVREPTPAPTSVGFSPLPVQVPTLDEELDEFDLRSVGPVSRRSMSYGWRSMRRLRADGPRTVLDVAGTVEQVARKGFYVGPVMRRRKVNHARLVLLIDQQGSMVPFHRWSRDLVETAKLERALASVSVFYFYNVPQEFLYEDEHLTKPIALAKVLEGIDDETSVVMVSDAGAARGRRNRSRIRETTRFMGKVRSRTEQVGWLNPMPMPRWGRSAAEILAYLVPMRSMDRDGFMGVIGAVTEARWHRLPERESP